MSLKILVSALEPSANLHLKPILEHLNEYELLGIFDESLGSPCIPSSSFGVMGFIDVLSKIKLAKKAIKTLATLSLEADHVLLIDSPAFNLPLARAIRKINPSADITYYILPQVWAWRPKRAKIVSKLCDNLASILPFERRFYKNIRYVGHPLLDEINFQKLTNSDTKKECIAFLAGSRKSEIKKLMPIFRELSKKISEKALLVVPSFLKEKMDKIYGDVSDFEISFNTHEALNRSKFAFVCSGTASLEAALIGTPFVLVYKAKKLDFMIAKSFVRLKYIGLANIIFDFEGLEAIHEELMQKDVNVEKLLNAYKNIDKEKFFQNSQKLKQILSHGSAENVASIIEKSRKML